MEKLNDGHTKYIPPMEYRRTKPFVQPEAPSFEVSDDGIFTVKINEFLHDYSDTVRKYLISNPNIELVRIDVRDNIGGNTIYGAKVAELFIPGEFHACQKWTRLQKGVDAAVASQTANMRKETLQRYLDEGLMTREDIQEDLRILAGARYEEYTDRFGSAVNSA